jgi:hypothetical protein
MDFDISEKLAKSLLNKIEPSSPLAQRLTEHGIYHGRMIVSSQLFDADALDILHALSLAGDDRALTLQVSALRTILNDATGTTPVWRIEALPAALIAFFCQGMIDGWLYARNRDGVLLPWLLHDIKLATPDFGSSYVMISLLANTVTAANQNLSDDPLLRRSGMTNSILVYLRDIAKRTIPEMLADKGFFKENAEFKQEYEAHARLFLHYQPQFGRQFTFKKAAFIALDQARPESIKLRDGVLTKCVNDEDILDRQFEMSANTDFWSEHGIWNGFEKIPLHCYVHLFHLELHRNIWVHVENLAPYEYTPALRDKLILPQQHRDLIDILTADMQVFMEDFVAGKSGGTTILCKGAPGLGKTLTAEVYAEVVGKPLYRVHSGQLGTSAASVEQNLSAILQRAARWDAILLLDEADVYIRCRDNDLQHNAIVAEFLRTLEYFNGLLFMTTNRIDDVDDAILSRCIATIKYELPSRENAIRLWQSLAVQLQAALPDVLIDALIDSYPKASGRDIKELLKLTSKFCKSKNIPLSEDAFRQCAVFRGVL